ncbi:MAG TPA: 3'-5' exonuclease, partial [Anaerolineae bacterium]
MSLDLETTGLDSERDAIIEIGIVRFRGDEILEEWGSLINPGRDIPAKVTELTSITNEMVREQGITLYKGLAEAQRIIGNLPVVGHNVMFDVSFMRRQRMLVANPTIDTFELAGILIPHAGQYSLSSLSRELEIDLTDAHRALNDAKATQQLYIKMFERALDLPHGVLEEITEHAVRSGWTLADFWKDALETQ